MAAECPHCSSVIKENKRLREANATATKMLAGFANENLALKKLLAENDIYYGLAIAEII